MVPRRYQRRSARISVIIHFSGARNRLDFASGPCSGHGKTGAAERAANMPSAASYSRQALLLRAFHIHATRAQGRTHLEGAMR
jgi:3-deoxy-D-arabino-heptulosonate 7-phosphate (DAHP) synthase